MEKITSIEELNAAISALEEKQALQGQLFKEQFLAASESLKPANIVKNLFSELFSSSSIKRGIITAATGVATYCLTRKPIFQSSKNPLARLSGSLLQLGLSRVTTQHSKEIKSVGLVLLQRLLHKKKANPKKAC
jgi:hypothetical protein